MSNGKCAVVTGASRGIGKSIARALAEAGYTVVGTATGEQGINSIKAALCAEYPSTVALGLNVTSDESIDRFVADLDELGLKPEVLVNNAGVTRDNLLLRMKDDEWNDVLATNLTSVFKLSKRLLRSMLKARAGRIINIGSVVGSSGNPGQSNYAAAKAGVHHLTRALAYEWASMGIHVNAVAPCITETPTRRQLFQRPGYKEWITGQMLPIKRWAQPQDIVGATLFLCSSLSDMVVGHILMVDGGWTIH